MGKGGKIHYCVFRDLFNVIYGSKIVQDFKEGKLDSEGNSREPSPLEQLSAEEVHYK